MVIAGAKLWTTVVPAADISPKPSELGRVSLYERCMSCGAIFRKVAKHVACEHETVALKISQKTAHCTSPPMSSYGEL